MPKHAREHPAQVKKKKKRGKKKEKKKRKKRKKKEFRLDLNDFGFI